MPAGPPPVEQSAVARTDTERMSPATKNYLTIVDTLKANRGAEAKAIQAMFGGDKRLMDRFLAVAFSLLAADSDILVNCEPLSVVQAIKDAAALGLEPMTDDAAIIRYGRQAKLQPMWRGYLKRIRNSREVVDIDCQLVYQNDRFEISLGTDPSIVHVPVLPEKDESGEHLIARGSYRGAYAWALMPSGKTIIEWMTADDINHIRDVFSSSVKAGRASPWDTSWGEMARKTVIRRLAKRLPASAVDKLLQADAQADAAAAEVRVLAEKLHDDMAEVRNLALQAVGAVPQLTDASVVPPQSDGTADAEPPQNVQSDPEPAEAAPAATEPGTPPPATAPDPGADPNVQAAMKMAEADKYRRRS